MFTRLFKDLAATHSSPYIHIGCDETHLLGHCPLCQKLAAEEGLSKLCFDHVKMLCDIVISLGKRPVLWADIALKHPEYLQLTLMATEPLPDQTFRRLNSETLFPAAIREETAIRTYRTHQLYQRLAAFK